MFDLPPQVCQFLTQHDLTQVALVSRGWSAVAAPSLYINPNLSRCTQEQLQAFLDSVMSSKIRRRSVLVLDLLLPSPIEPSRGTVFQAYDRCDIDPRQSFRHSGALFTELFATFKKLVALRIYGHSLADDINAHWKSLGSTLVELKIYNLGALTDGGLLALVTRLSKSLKILHLEHPAGSEVKSQTTSEKSIRVGTIDHILEVCTNLKYFGIGCPIKNIKNDKSFLERLFEIESVTFLRVPELEFEPLLWASLNCSWKSLTVRDCPGIGPKDLDAVLRRLPQLESLDWRFTNDTYYDWVEHELKTASCRKLKTLVLENGFFSDQCLMRIFRVVSNLEFLALANCEEIHRIRPTCAQHYVLQELTSLMSDPYEVFEDCLMDLRSITFVSQKFSTKRLVASVNWLFRDAKDLEFIEFRDCSFGLSGSAEASFWAQMSRTLLVSQKDFIIRLSASATTVRRGLDCTRNGMNLLSFDARMQCFQGVTLPELSVDQTIKCTRDTPYLQSRLDPLRKSSSNDSIGLRFLDLGDMAGDSTSSEDDIQPEATASSILLKHDISAKPGIDERSSPSLSVHRTPASKASEVSEAWPEFSVDDITPVEQDLVDVADDRSGWPAPKKLLAWGNPEFEILERQKKTRFWNPNGLAEDADTESPSTRTSMLVRSLSQRTRGTPRPSARFNTTSRFPWRRAFPPRDSQQSGLNRLQRTDVDEPKHNIAVARWMSADRDQSPSGTFSPTYIQSEETTRNQLHAAKELSVDSQRALEAATEASEASQAQSFQSLSSPKEQHVYTSTNTSDVIDLFELPNIMLRVSDNMSTVTRDLASLSMYQNQARDIQPNDVLASYSQKAESVARHKLSMIPNISPDSSDNDLPTRIIKREFWIPRPSTFPTNAADSVVLSKKRTHAIPIVNPETREGLPVRIIKRQRWMNHS